MTLNLNKVSETYFSKLFIAKNQDSSKNGSKAKVLLVDRSTTPIISMSYTQSQLLQNDIILIELIENQHDLTIMKHLNCIVYIKPTKESIQSLIQELRSPHFNSYQLFLNNTIGKNQLEKLAEADEFEVIQGVVELFQDYVIVNHNLFVTQKEDGIPVSKSTDLIVEESNSITSLLLSLKKCPVIKYEQNSIGLKRLSSEILYNINSNSNNNLFEDLNEKSDTPPILLLLDRKNDPCTPLITPWTYQSMIHELIGIKKNIVDLTEANESVTLSETQDKFYKESMYLNYGDLTERFQRYVEEYKSQTKQSWGSDNLNNQNLSELKKMLTKFPEFKKLSTNILKHLNLISELDKKISSKNLWEIGELQQTLICELESQQILRTRINDLFDSPNIPTNEKLKLVLLYTIKHPNAPEIAGFIAKLNDPSKASPTLSLNQNGLIKSFKSLVGSNMRTNNSGGNNKGGTSGNQGPGGNLGNIFNKKININNLFNNNKGNHNSKTDNIYMQYIPRLNDILESLITPTQENIQESKNLSTLVPDAVTKQYGASSQNDPVQDIIIYVKGGVTFEESRLIHEIGQANPKINLTIGGDRIINSDDWLKILESSSSESTDVSVEESRADKRTQLRDLL